MPIGEVEEQKALTIEQFMEKPLPKAQDREIIDTSTTKTVP